MTSLYNASSTLQSSTTLPPQVEEVRVVHVRGYDPSSLYPHVLATAPARVRWYLVPGTTNTYNYVAVDTDQ